MDFKERFNPTTTVKVLQNSVPDVQIHPTALQKMLVYVDECKKEIGWLGTAYRNNEVITIQDVFLFDQEVHITTTEITPDGLSGFGEELLQREDGMDIWNNLKVWGHSHVNMSVSPSTQDDKQMETFKDGGHDWFIRIIANKKGELKVDLYDFQIGVIYNDLPWKKLLFQEELEIEEQIAKLYKLLDEKRKARIDMVKEPIKEEMKVKVKKKTYATGFKNQYSRNYLNPNGKTITLPTVASGKKIKTKFHEEVPENIYDAGELEDGGNLFDYFILADLIEIGECKTYYQVNQSVRDMLGSIQGFTVGEINQIWEIGKRLIELGIEPE